MGHEANEVAVDTKIFREGLSCLGKTFNNARHAYLKLNVEAKALTTLKGVERYTYLQYLDVSNNKLTCLVHLGGIKHLIKLNASNNCLKKMFDFSPMANLEVVDYSHNQIEVIENVIFNPYVKHLCLDDNKIKKIEGLFSNKSLTSLSLRQNAIVLIENLDGLNLEELNLSQNNISKISGLGKLPNLKELDLSKNHIQHLVGLQNIESLRFLNLSLNNIVKVLQLQFIERLNLLTELDFSFNPIQNKKHYRSQVLYHIPQLRMLDGVLIIAEEKAKSENLHGVDLKDRESIFKAMLPQENFVDRRIAVFEDIEDESEDENEYEKQGSMGELGSVRGSNVTDHEFSARQYVGELFNRVAAP